MSSLTAHESAEEDNWEDYAEWADNNVCDGHEVILSTKRISCTHNERLATFECWNVVSTINNKLVSAGLKIIINYSVQLAEIRQTGCAHPYDEVRIFDVGPLDTFPCCWVCIVYVVYKLFLIGFPGNVIRIKINLVIGSFITPFVCWILGSRFINITSTQICWHKQITWSWIVWAASSVSII